MIRKQIPALIALGLLLGAAGCVSCGHEACPRAIEAGPHCSEPQCDRKHVYAFLVNGLAPNGALEELRLKLAERGYEKVYRGELCHAWWLWREMKRVRSCDPESRFVLVGYGFGCAGAACLAKDAVREGLPVDGVVLIDPAGVKDPRACAERTVIIRSGQTPEDDGEAGCVRVPLCGHFSLPTHEGTVDAIAVILAESAMRVEHVEVEAPIFWHQDAPAPREFRLPAAGTTDEWLFLHDRLGPHNVPLPSPYCPGSSVPGFSPGWP